jgi:hypothetical protein
MRIPETELLHHMFETFFQVGIDKDAVKVSRRLSVFQFCGGIGQTRLNGVLLFRISPPQALFQFFFARWGDEDIIGIQMTFFDFADPLHVDIQYTYLATLLYRFDSFNTYNKKGEDVIVSWIFYDSPEVFVI